MKRKDAQALSTVMDLFMNQNYTLKVKLAEYRAIKAWNELLGEGVARFTKKVYLNRNVLYVQLTSSALRAELLLNKKMLVEKINNYAGVDVVKDLVLR